MKILDVSAVTDAAQVKIKQGTLKFLQDANKEAFAALLIGLIGPSYSTSNVYIIYGCINSGTFPTYNISEGAAFYDGEIFLIDAASFTVTGLNVAVMSLQVTQYTVNADPVTFTDSTVHNIHNIRKILISAGPSGSGLSNYVSAVVLSFVIPQQVELTGAGVTGSYPNYVIPGGSGLFPAVAAGNKNVGNIGDSGTTITVPLGVTLPSTNYMPIITIISNNNNVPGYQDANVFYAIGNKTVTSFDVYLYEWTPTTQNISLDWVVLKRY